MTATLAWWAWPLLLFVTTFLLGIVAVAGGIGGGVLFVPIVAAFFPFHLDFVRGAGLLVALCGSLAAGPALLRGGLASLRVAMPVALAGSIASIVGAYAGLALPTKSVQLALGIVVLAIVALMWVAGSREPAPGEPDALGRVLGLTGVYRDPRTGEQVAWSVRRTGWGIAAFAVIGFVGGLFGLGAGWANVPALNLLMALPLKLSLGTSGLAISIINSSASWVYLNEGALLPVMHVPAIVGVMLGARVGTRLLERIHRETARKLVMAILLVAGARSLWQGLVS